MPKLLIVDDEPNILYSFRKRLQSESLQVTTAATAAEGIEQVRSEAPDAVLLDIRLPDMSGLDAFEQIRDIDARLPVVIMTAFSTTDTAIDAMRRGAYEYLIKPVDIRQLRYVVDQAIELSRLSHVPAVIGEGNGSDGTADRIIGRSPVMQQVYKSIGRVAAQDVPVLVLGESGTGKELVARALFHYSNRADQTFLALNCAALTESLLESELFGHEQGAFTGADRRRIGKFEQANGGTLFLDELGDMSTATQAKLLRILQDGRFERVGGNETIQANVRIIAATNQDLEAKVAAGEFRQDLLYRLKVYTIELPPLRDRSEDLPLLTDRFLKMYAEEMGREAVTIAPDALKSMQRYSWPGNVRELQSAIRTAVVHAVGNVITSDCLPDAIREDQRLSSRGDHTAELPGLIRAARQLLDTGHSNIYRTLQDEFDRAVIRETLRFVKGNQVQAAERLGMSRTTLRSRMAALGIGDDDD